MIRNLGPSRHWVRQGPCPGPWPGPECPRVDRWDPFPRGAEQFCFGPVEQESCRGDNRWKVSFSFASLLYKGTSMNQRRP